MWTAGCDREGNGEVTLEPVGSRSPSPAVPASNTRRSYDSAWRRFETWCAGEALSALPASADTVARYLEAASEERTDGRHRYQRTTFGVWLAAIGERHTRADVVNPVKDSSVQSMLSTIRDRRSGADESARTTSPLRTVELQSLVTSIGDQARGWVAHIAARRDIALLVMGFSGALQGGDLARLEVRDVRVADDRAGQWLAVRLRGRQTHAGATESAFLPRGQTSARWCPWCGYLRWLAVIAGYDSAVEQVLKAARERELLGTQPDWAAAHASAADHGAMALTRLIRRDTTDPDEHICDRPWPHPPHTAVPLFRSLRNGTPREKQALTAGSISRMLQRRAAAAGFEAAGLLSARAMRAGAATEAFDRGASLPEVMALTRHRSAAAARRYDATADVTISAATDLGL